MYYNTTVNNFIVSTNLMLLLKNKYCEINNQSLVEFSIFDYILGNKTFFKDIFKLEYGENINYKNIIQKRTVLYDYSNLIQSELLRTDESIELFSKLLKDNIHKFIKDKDIILLALTGGFDGRLNLALMDKIDYKKIVCYTYGMAKSNQISIAKEISSKLLLDYKPILLEDDYENGFCDNGYLAIMLSNGYAPFMRANFVYSFNKLKYFSRYSLNGLFGSELIRPMHICGGQSLNYSTIEIFMSGNFDESFDKIYKKYLKCGFIMQKYFTNEIKDTIKSYIKDNYIDKYSGFTKKEILFIFYLKEGMRKFFMEELSIDKYFIEQYSPYLDIDFIELLFKSPFAGLYNGIFEESRYKRRKGQLFYAHLMEKANNELSRIKTDRGYRPVDLLNNYNLYKVFLGYVFGKYFRKKIIGNDTYNTRKWENLFFKKYDNIIFNKDELYDNNLSTKYKNGEYLFNDGYDFSRHFSLKLWFKEINKILMNQN